MVAFISFHVNRLRDGPTHRSWLGGTLTVFGLFVGRIAQPLVVVLLGVVPFVGLGGALAATVDSPARSPELVLASNDLAIGFNRFTFAVLDNNHPVQGGTATVTFYYARGNVPVRAGSTTARFNWFARGLRDNDQNSSAVAIGGVFVAHTYFRRAGQWGVEVRVRVHRRQSVLRQAFSVRIRGLTPAVGTPAPRSHNPTVAQMPVSKLDSGHPPDDMHKLSIANAIAQHKPLVVLFSTPGFCTSRMCGPETEIVQRLERRYRGRVNFIHIEIYKDADPARGYAPTVLQWHIPTEPWVFVVDRAGIIRAKFEGPTAENEIAPAIDAAVRR